MNKLSSICFKAKQALKGLQKLGDSSYPSIFTPEMLADALSGLHAQRQPIFPSVHELKNFGNRFIRYDYRPFYGWGGNLGDWIQSEATEYAIRKIMEGESPEFIRWQRSELSWYRGAPVICVMQGWFDNETLDFLPNSNVLPVWIGTHFTNQIRRRLEWGLRFKQTMFSGQEIGCRDLSTYKWCQKHNIKAYFSRCLTLTFPRRDASPRSGKVFCVNCPDWLIKCLPPALRKEAELIDQRGCNFGYTLMDERRYEQAARLMLERFKNEARLIITTALHCAQPCLAMGIPVVFVDPGYNEADRFSSMRGIIPIWTRTDALEGKINFDPVAPDIEPLKQDILENLRLSLLRALGRKVDSGRLSIIRERIHAFDILREPMPTEMANKDVRIYVVYHKAAPTLDKSPFIPLQVGNGTSLEGFLRDNTGDNIAAKNPNYCELTAQYWIWKNVRADYVGLCHYRRIPSFIRCNVSEFSKVSDETYRRFGWTERRVKTILSRYDVILPPNWEMFPPGEPGNFVSAYDFFTRQYGTETMDKLLEVIRWKSPEFTPYIKPVLLTPRRMSFGNIAIMRKDLYDTYSEWLFSVLFELENRIQIPKKKEDARVFGYLGEYLLNLWVERAKEQLGIRVWYASHLIKMTFDASEEYRLETEIVIRPASPVAHPKLSVIIPVYNVEQYLRRCLNSVCGQAEENIEVLCVNDGSTDSSASILEAFARLDGRIRIIQQKNKGLGAARNRGIDIAQGKWLAFVDSDDWIDRVVWHRTIAKSERLQLDMCLFEPVDVNENTRQRSQSSWERLRLPEQCYKTFFTWRDIGRTPFDTCCYAPTRIIRRSFLGRRRFPEGVLYEDAALHYDLLFSAQRIGAYACPYYFYRRRAGSLMKIRDMRILDHLKIVNAVATRLQALGLFKELEKPFLEYATGLLRKTYKMMPTELCFQALCRWLTQEPQHSWDWAHAGRLPNILTRELKKQAFRSFALHCQFGTLQRQARLSLIIGRIRDVLPFREIVKQFVPYGIMCTWLRSRYGLVEDLPLLAYPGVIKRMKRTIKFALPYGVIKAWKRRKI